MSYPRNICAFLLLSSVSCIPHIRGDRDKLEDTGCGLYIAPSTQPDTALGLFAGKPRKSGDHIFEPDLMISIPDANKNDWSPWHDFIWKSDFASGVHLENDFWHDVFVPGVPSMAACAPNLQLLNAIPDEKTRVYDSLGVHRSKDPSAGAFTYHAGYSYRATRPIQAGQEIFISCQVGAVPVKFEDDIPLPSYSLNWLEKHGVCIDSLHIKPSTIPGIGRGAFAKRAVGVGQIITTTPLIHFDRSQVLMVEQSYQLDQILPLIRDHGILYTHNITHRQLILNYAFGTPDSTVLLLPTAPGVNYINHNREKANAYVRWSIASDVVDTTYPLLNMLHFDLLDEQADLEHQLFFDIVAIRNINPGEEIFLDYGDEWIAAWKNHLRSWNPMQNEQDYVSAADYKLKHEDDFIRTIREQSSQPYPSNIRTACYFMPREMDDVSKPVHWNSEHQNCLRHCDFMERSGSGKETSYVVVVKSRSGVVNSQFCGELYADVVVTDVPSQALTLVDASYSTDMYLTESFRHEIGVPEGLYPMKWLMTDPKPNGDFIPTPLAPGQIEPVRWSDTGKVVTENGLRLGIDPKTRETLLDYCEKMGITEIFRHVTSYGNALKPGTNTFITLDNEQWYLQRPEPQWRSNLQWLSPGGNPAHEHYLQALSVAGFDALFDSIGNYFNLSGIVAYHVTFIAVSSSSKGYLHYDVTETGAKTFNIIMPLILPNETGPELDLQNRPAPGESEDSADAYRIGRYRNEYNVATMMGDDSYHASSAVDYRVSGEMRMAATVYISDVNEDNVDNIIHDYTQEYPPRDRDLLLSWAGRHWRRNDPSVKLPKPPSDHILVPKDSDILSEL